MAENGSIGGGALRVLRFLAKGEAAIREAAAQGRVLLEIEGAGVLGAEQDVLTGLAREGLVDRAHQRATLTAVGRMALKRAMAQSEPHSAQHQERDTGFVMTQNGREEVTVNHAESPLALLWRRRNKDGSGFLSPREFRAGERLRVDYSRGCIMPSLGVNWGAIGGGGRQRGEAGGIGELSDAALAARMRVEKALAAVGPELGGVLVDVCCFLKGLERVEAERNWPVRSAKVVLKSALASLARHYEPCERGGRQQAVLHWGAQDYRPRIV